MKIMILDNIAKELKGRGQTALFGRTDKWALIVTSLKPKPGLERIGTFLGAGKASKKNEFIFSMFPEGLASSYLALIDGPRSMSAGILPYTTDFQKRNRGLLDSSILQKRAVTIVGLGSGGSALALALLRSGLTNQTWIEFDTISLSNLCRSEYTLPDVGKKKTEALLEKALAINPCANILVFEEDVLEMDFEKLKRIIQESDLIIEATDSQKTKILINGLARHTTPVIYPAVYSEGRGGDIGFTLPIKGFPCFECIYHSIIGQKNDNQSQEWDYTTGQPKPMPALLADIQVICARTTKIALALLTGDQENSFLEKVTKPGCTLLLIGNERNVSGFEEPFTEAWVETRINPDCTCQTLK